MAALAVGWLASCGVPPQFNGHKAQILADVENRVAVAKLGVKVCREYRVGVSEQNWVQGIVTGVIGDEIVVTVEDPGRILMDVQGIQLKKGVHLKDVPRAWTPCF